MDTTSKRGITKIFPSDDKKTSTVCFQAYKPLMFGFVTGAFVAVNSVIVKLLPHVSLPKIILVRGLGTFVFNLPFLVHCTRIEGTFRKSDLPNLVTRGLLGTAVITFNFLSWKLMPIADAGIIVSTTPIWVIILSSVLLKENLDLLNSLSVVSSMIGLVLLSRVFSFIFSSASQKYSDSSYWYGCLCALSSSIMLAVAAIFLRKMKNVPDSLIVTFQSLCILISSAIAVLVQWDWSLPKCGSDGTLLVTMGIGSFVGEALFSAAFKHDKAAAVSSVRTSSQIVFQFISQVSILNEIPDVYSILATMCIFISLWLSGLRKYRQEKRRSTAQRKCNTPSVQDETNV